MTNTYSRFWWMPLLRGIFAVLFGVLALLFPGITLTTLVFVFGAYAFVDGVFAIIHSFRNKGFDWGFAEGIIGIIAGVAAFLIPSITGLTLLFLIAFWAMFSGILELVMAWQLRQEIDNEFWMALAGVLSFLFGLFILFDPLGGALATAWLIGLYAITFGIMLIGLGFRLRTTDEQPPHRQQTPLNA